MQVGAKGRREHCCCPTVSLPYLTAGVSAERHVRLGRGACASAAVKQQSETSLHPFKQKEIKTEYFSVFSIFFILYASAVVCVCPLLLYRILLWTLGLPDLFLVTPVS